MCDLFSIFFAFIHQCTILIPEPSSIVKAKYISVNRRQGGKVYLGLVFANIQSSFLLHLDGSHAMAIKLPLRSRGSYPTHTSAARGRVIAV